MMKKKKQRPHQSQLSPSELDRLNSLCAARFLLEQAAKRVERMSLDAFEEFDSPFHVIAYVIKTMQDEIENEQ